MPKHIVVIDLVGATPAHFEAEHGTQPMFPELSQIFRGKNIRPLKPVFPAVTCPVQVSMVTGALPSQHGIIANGLFDRDKQSVTMWTWPASKIERPAVWSLLKKRQPRAKTAMFFFQGLKATDADIYINPHPRHTPDGKTIPWCDANPPGQYERLVAELGHFPLHKYWGPMAGIESSKWILDASQRTIAEHRPELSFVYVPHLDYVGQRSGPDSTQFADEAKTIDKLVAAFVRSLTGIFGRENYSVVIVSEYALVPVTGAVMPNIALRDAGLLSVKEIDGREEINIESSRAFAMADHQLAHVYVNGDAVDEAAEVLAKLDGIAEVCRGERLKQLGCAHKNAGELVLLAQPDKWFQYYWWHEGARAPQYARTVDIHRKPGYDPVELFFDPATKSIPLDASLVKGSHGLPPASLRDYGVFASLGEMKLPQHELHAVDVCEIVLTNLIEEK